MFNKYLHKGLTFAFCTKLAPEAFFLKISLPSISSQTIVLIPNNSHSEELKETERRDKVRKIKRYAAIGLATIGGGTLLGLTGGLAAPFIGAGVGTILGSASAAALGSTAGIAIIGSLFGVAGAGLTGSIRN